MRHSKRVTVPPEILGSSPGSVSANCLHLLVWLYICLSIQLFSSSVGVLYGVPGSTLVIPCLPGQKQQSFAGAKITWKYNDSLVPDYPESSEQLKLSPGGFFLEIAPVSVANEGEYECVIKQNDMGWQKVNIIQVDMSSSYILKVNEGSTVNLPCERPPSSNDQVHWYRYDKVMRNCTRKQLNPADTGEMEDVQSMQFYDADPVKLTNSSEVNVEMINSWVAKQTNNKIKELVNSVPAHTELVLLNAVYFNGQWKMKFDAKSKKFPFVKLNGDTVLVPVLYSAKYKLAMQYVPALMAQLSDLQLVEGKMMDKAVSQMMEQMNQVSPQATERSPSILPFSLLALFTLLLHVRLLLIPHLFLPLGLSELFDSANLCGLYPDNELLLTDARHRAFLSLTEQGVEAGAATSLSFSRSFSSFSAPRPFLMILWSDQAKAPLFVGRVTEP
uniref:plasma protease C1 inhibitor-like n=1 Tax=Oncorhynchus gorbuscha TaxID=8017 RepID=UPI001EAECD18|nr:plasma protease C1 inhibitor-like [Oncorhynchus gorbuscha]